MVLRGGAGMEGADTSDWCSLVLTAGCSSGCDAHTRPWGLLRSALFADVFVRAGILAEVHRLWFWRSLGVVVAVAYLFSCGACLRVSCISTYTCLTVVQPEMPLGLGSPTVHFFSKQQSSNAQAWQVGTRGT